MTRVFISYSRRDEAIARKIAQSLADTGIDVWMDVEDIEIGSKWSKAIQQGLDSSDVLCVILSPSSMESPNVEDEFTYFLDQKKPVIPIYWKPTKVHFQLGRIQYIDFYTNPYDTALKLLLQEIQKRKAQTPVIPPAPSATVRTEKLTVNKTAEVAADSASVSKSVSRKEGAGELASPANNRRLVMIAGVMGIVVIALAAVLVIGLINRANEGRSDNPSLTGETLGGDGAVKIVVPQNWEWQNTQNGNVWIANDNWFFNHGVLNESVNDRRISLQTVGQVVEGEFTHADLVEVAVGTANNLFQRIGVRQQLTANDFQSATINDYPAIWVEGQLNNSDYYMVFYYMQDKNRLMGVIVNTGKGEFDRNRQLIDDLVNSIQVTA